MSSVLWISYEHGFHYDIALSKSSACNMSQSSDEILNVLSRYSTYCISCLCVFDFLNYKDFRQPCLPLLGSWNLSQLLFLLKIINDASYLDEFVALDLMLATC